MAPQKTKAAKLAEKAEWRIAVGRRLRQAREGAGFLNVSEFAREIGVSPNAYYRYEQGKIAPGIDVLARIAAKTHTLMEWFVTGQNPEVQPVFDAWRRTPRGQAASREALHFLERLPIGGHVPKIAFYDLALMCMEMGLTPSDAAGTVRRIDRIEEEGAREVGEK